jgi:ABC-type lipoprotein release transport system permease subunit
MSNNNNADSYQRKIKTHQQKIKIKVWTNVKKTMRRILKENRKISFNIW